MHDIGTAVWVVLVIIGVVSSLASKAKKAAAAAQAAPQRPTPEAYVPVHEQAFVPAPPIVITKRKVPQAAVAPAVLEDAFPLPKPRRDGTSSFRGMFDRPNLARAFLAAQVFGPPKALQEQSIWSLPHNEPSI